MASPNETRKNLKPILKLARNHGWTVELRKSGHYRFTSPDGTSRISFSGSASDYRSIKNLRAVLRRAGLPVPHK